MLFLKFHRIHTLWSLKQGSCLEDFAYVINNSLSTLTYHRLNKTAKYAWPWFLSNERQTRDQDGGAEQQFVKAIR